MAEIIIIICLCLILIIFLRRLPDVHIEGIDEKENSEMAVSKLIQSVDKEFEDKKQYALKLLTQAENYFLNHDYINAEKCYLKLATVDPDNGKIYGRLGIIYLKGENYKDAKDAFTEAIKKEPNNDFWFNNLGLCLHKLNECQESIGCFKRAIQIKATSQKLINLSRVYEDINQIPAACAAIESAIRLEPNNQELNQNLISLKSKITSK